MAVKLTFTMRKNNSEFYDSKIQLSGPKKNSSTFEFNLRLVKSIIQEMFENL